MRKFEKEFYKDRPVIAVYPMGLKGISILAIESGIEDHIVLRDVDDSLHRLKIYWDIRRDEDYFKISGRRVYLNECMRTHI